MRKLALSLFLTGFMALSSHADTLKMQANAPDRYVVVKGDLVGHFRKIPQGSMEMAANLGHEQAGNPESALDLSG